MKRSRLKKFFDKNGYSGLIIIAFVIYIGVQFSTPVLILDSGSMIPISADEIRYNTGGAFFSSGCTMASQTKNETLSFFGPLLYRCKIIVKKKGYNTKEVVIAGYGSMILRFNIIFLRKEAYKRSN